MDTGKTKRKGGYTKNEWGQHMGLLNRHREIIFLLFNL